MLKCIVIIVYILELNLFSSDKVNEKKGNGQITTIHKPLMYALYLHSDKYLKPILIRYQGKSEDKFLILLFFIPFSIFQKFESEKIF